MKTLNVCTTIFLFLFLLVGIQSTLWAQVDSDGDLNADVADPYPTDPTRGGVFAGATITYDVLLAGDLDATGFTGTVITIAKNDVTFDGDGHTVTAPDASEGIVVQSSQGVMLTNVSITGAATGLHLITVTNSTVRGVTSDRGIRISFCTNVVIENCTIDANIIHGILIGSSQNVRLTNIEITGTTIGLYLNGVTGSTIDDVTCLGPGNDGIYMSNSADNVVENCTFPGRGSNGIYIVGSSSTNNIIRDNDLRQCGKGVYAFSSSGNEFLKNDCSGSGWGLFVLDPAAVSGNDLSNCLEFGSLAIGGYSSSSSLPLQGVLTTNIFTGSNRGLYLRDVVSGSTISDLDFTGVGDITALEIHNSEELEISDLTLPATGIGLYLYKVDNSTINRITSIGPGERPRGSGIQMYNSSDNTIENCKLSGRGTGINIRDSSSNNTIRDNDLRQCNKAVYSVFSSSPGNRFIKNNCSESGWGLDLLGPAEVTENDLSDCRLGSLGVTGYPSSSPMGLQDVLRTNVFTGSAKALVLFGVVSGTTISGLDFTGVDATSALQVVRSDGVQFSNLTLPVTYTGYGTGLQLNQVTNSTVSGAISVDSSVIGISMGTCADVVIENCTVSSDATDILAGIKIQSSQSVMLNNVEITGAIVGLTLSGVTNSEIDGVTSFGPGPASGGSGITLYNSADNVIRNSTFSGRKYGVTIYGTDSDSNKNNKVYNNNIFGNTWQAHIYGGGDNVLDLPAPLGGNYWGRSCPGPLFVPDEDSTSASDVVDNLPYATLNGWLNGGAPGCNPPVVGAITAPTDPVAVNTEIDADADFTDPDEFDTHTAEWDWGDNSASLGVVDETGGSGSVTGNHIYTTAGVYTITLTVTDNYGVSGESVSDYVVVYYDLNAGFVTGGGWIDSLVGAYAADPDLTGRANFGFVSKYKKGATTPSGETEFNFSVADLNFHSEEYQWLLVAGPKAKFKGDGTINGAGNFGFMLSAVDAALTSSTDVDLFRIKIWDKDDGDSVVYDNQMDNVASTDATTEIGGGNIVIHKGGATAAPALVKATPSESQLDQNYPNPFNPETWIPYRLKEDASVTISIYSTTGRLVRRFSLGHKETGSYTSMARAVHWNGRNEHGERVSSGLYFYTMQAGEFTATKKMIIAE